MANTPVAAKPTAFVSQRDVVMLTLIIHVVATIGRIVIAVQIAPSQPLPPVQSAATVSATVINLVCKTVVRLQEVVAVIRHLPQPVALAADNVFPEFLIVVSQD